MALKPVSVTQLNEYISRVIGTDPLLMNVGVQGEISGVGYDGHGNCYFSLMDDSCSVSCIIWHDTLLELGVDIKEGLEVILRGYLNVYKKRGTFSLTVRTCELVGAGGLALAFEEMKKKLEKEGLFDESHKKKLPFFPHKIAVVTAETGAAVKDIEKTIKSRNDFVSIYVYPSQVQGTGAAEQIAARVDEINDTRDDIDIIIVGRGGGSAEDLWPFNEEVVARSIYRSRIPVISAVGHEIDYSISDLVADVRAATPTAAGQIAVPDTSELREEIDEMKRSMLRQLVNIAQYDRIKADNLMESMRDHIKNRIAALRSDTEKMKLTIEYNDPGKIMLKGYSIVRNRLGKVITDPDQAGDGEELDVSMAKGSLAVKALKKERDR